MREHFALKVFLIVLFAVFAVHQLYSSLYKPITTETAQYFEVVSGVSADGVIIRREKIITNSAPGVLHYITADGSRAAKGGTIAEIYSDASVSGKISRMHAIESELESISQIEEYNNVRAVDMDTVNAKVSNALNYLIRSGASGSFHETQDLCENLLITINRRQALTGELIDFSSRKSALSEELNTLKSSIPAPTGSIVTDVSGYFISSTDGFENALNPDSLDSITPEFLNDIKTEKVPENAIGKIVYDYEWYIAATLPVSDALKYKPGDLLTVKPGNKSTDELPVEVNMINMSENADTAVVILSCRQMNSELAVVRHGKFTIVSKTYKGLRLSKKDLRVLDSVTGVYTVSGLKLKFVPVNVIYSTEDFIICEQKHSENNALKLYDEVVVKGKGLYDGKIIG